MPNKKNRKLAILDFDGTLARIRRDPRDSRLSAATRKLLELLVQHQIRVVILSGRPAQFLARQMPNGIELAGSRGNALSTQNRSNAKRFRHALKPLKNRFNGILVRTNPTDVDVHFRGARGIDGKKLEKAVRAKARGLHARVLRGRKVFSVVPWAVRDKSAAVKKIAANWKDPILFLGDDDSDAAAAGVLAGKKNCRCGLVKNNERTQKIPKGIVSLNGIKGVQKELRRFLKS